MLPAWSHSISSNFPAAEHVQNSWSNLSFLWAEALRQVFQKCLLLVPVHSCCPDTKGSLINQRQICLGFAQSCLLMSRHKNTSHMSEYISRTWQRLIFIGVLVIMSNEPLLLKQTNKQQKANKQTKKGLSEKCSIWFFVSVLGELTGTTDFRRSANFAADILICTRDAADFKRKVWSEGTEQDGFVYRALQNFSCVTSALS